MNDVCLTAKVYHKNVLTDMHTKFGSPIFSPSSNVSIVLLTCAWLLLVIDLLQVAAVALKHYGTDTSLRVTADTFAGRDYI
jgi:hypothetical protein